MKYVQWLKTRMREVRLTNTPEKMIRTNKIFLKHLSKTTCRAINTTITKFNKSRITYACSIDTSFSIVFSTITICSAFWKKRKEFGIHIFYEIWTWQNQKSHFVSSWGLCACSIDIFLKTKELKNWYNFASM